MAVVAGKTAVFKLDTAGDALTDISAYVDTVALQRTLDKLESTCLGSSAKSSIPGLADATIPFGGPYDPTLDDLLEGIYTAGTIAHFSYAPNAGTPNTTTPAYTGTCWVSSYNVTSAVTAIGRIEGTLQVTGAVTRDDTP